MDDFLRAAAASLLVLVAVGLLCILRGPRDVDRLMAAQLFGSGGIASLLLFEAASGLNAVIDVALTLAVLAAFASVAFVKAGTQADDAEPRR